MTRPTEPHPGNDDRGLEHTERGRDDLGLDLAEQRSATREVRRAVGRGDSVAERPGTRREAELLVRGVTLGREEHLPDDRFEGGGQRAGPAAKVASFTIGGSSPQSRPGRRVRQMRRSRTPHVRCAAVTDDLALLDATAQADLVARGEVLGARTRRRRDRPHRAHRRPAQRRHPSALRAGPRAKPPTRDAARSRACRSS